MYLKMVNVGRVLHQQEQSYRVGVLLSQYLQYPHLHHNNLDTLEESPLPLDLHP